MAIDRLPSGLVPSGGSLIFEETTIPDALKREHALAAGHWGVLHVLEGDIRFVDLASGEERIFSAPDLVTIQPQAPHLVIIDGLVRCRIDFFRELGADSLMRTPGSFADEAVRASFERCELNGDFAEFFYDAFLNSSAEIASHFAQTEFERQRKVLRDSVHVMVTRDVADAAMRVMLDRLGICQAVNCGWTAFAKPSRPWTRNGANRSRECGGFDCAPGCKSSWRPTRPPGCAQVTAYGECANWSPVPAVLIG